MTAPKPQLEALTDDLLVYLRRRAWGVWSVEYDLYRDGFNVTHEGRDGFFAETQDLLERGAEYVSARLIAAVKRAERARKERKTA